MTGYRQHSFDPNAGVLEQRPPVRPYNWVQWTGVALVLAAVVLNVIFVGGSIGWWPKVLSSPSIAISLPLFGVALINSRRQPSTDPAPELAAARRKWLAITVAIAAVILGVATIFAMKGY